MGFSYLRRSAARFPKNRTVQNRRATAGALHHAIEPLEVRRLLTAIASGQTMVGSIVTAGQTVSYTFNATANESFEMSLGVASSASTFLPLLNIFDPNGVELNTSISHGTSTPNTSVSQFYQVPSNGAGTYTAIVQSNTATNTGAYALELAAAPASQSADADGDGGTISSGQTKTGTISRPGDLDVFTFSATANESFEMSLGVASSASIFLPLLNIFDPNGNELNTSFSHGTANSNSSVNQGYQVPLSGAGVYTAIVQGDLANNTGAYAVELAGAPATQAADADGDGGTIASGQTRTGTINRPGDVDVFTFSTTANESFEMSLGVANSASTFLPLLNIFDANGNELNTSFSHGTPTANSSVSQFYQVPLSGAGVYTVFVQGDLVTNTGAYALELAGAQATQTADADGDGGTIASGQTKTGTINRPGDLDVFTFNATANESFEMSLGVASSSSTFLPLLDIFDPNGNELNTSVTHGTANQDSSVSQGYQVPLSGAGVYTAIVRSDTATNTGAYALELGGAPATQSPDADGDGGVIASGQTKAGTINRPGDLDVFTFTTAANESFEMSLGVASSASTFLPSLDIFDSNGNQLNTSFTHGTATTDSSVSQFYQVPLSGAGVYTAIVRGDLATNTGAYALELAATPASQSPDADGDGGAIFSGQTKTGTINRPGDLDVFTFTARANQELELSLGVSGASSTFLPSLDIFDPNGNELNTSSSHGTAAANSSVSQFYQVPSNGAGVYTAIVHSDLANRTGTYALELAVAPATQSPDADGDGGVIFTGQTKSGTINRPGDLDVYTFPAVAGDSLTVSDTVVTSGLNLELLLYDPNGVLLRSGNSTSAITLTANSITTTGTYTVVVQSGTATGTGGYTLTLNDAAATRTPPWLAPDSGAVYTLNNNTLTVTSGTVTFLADASSTNPGLIVTASGTAHLTFWTTQNLGPLTLNGSATAWFSDGGGKFLHVTSLAIAPSATLDLKDDTLLLDYTGTSPLGSWNGSSYNGVLGLLQSGHAKQWTGTGIDSSVAALNSGFGLGVGEASTLLHLSGSQTGTWSGQPVDATTVIVKYTLVGDTNLDGSVNFSDLLVLAQNYNKTGGGWGGGDFNYDGSVNFTDLLGLAQEYNRKVS